MEQQLPEEQKPQQPESRQEPFDSLVERLSRDLKASAKLLGRREVRYIVDTYYGLQKVRIAAEDQAKKMAKDEPKEPIALVSWFSEQMYKLEKEVPKTMDVWVKVQQPVGDWLLSIYGIGPVLAAGLLAHIDIEKAPTAGHIWSFAGIWGPTQVWEKGKKRPWNAALKTLCWKVGESFVMVSGREEAYYGHVYADRKKLEEKRNEAGMFAQQAKEKLEKFKIGKNTDAYAAYSVGKLPPAHLHARAKRYAVKLFLSHLHEKMYVAKFGKMPPNPYPIGILGHPQEHYIPPPQ